LPDREKKPTTARKGAAIDIVNERASMAADKGGKAATSKGKSVSKGEDREHEIETTTQLSRGGE